MPRKALQKLTWQRIRRVIRVKLRKDFRTAGKGTAISEEAVTYQGNHASSACTSTGTSRSLAFRYVRQPLCAESRSTPRYLILGRDSIYGTRFRNRVRSLGIEEVLTALRSPWQNPYVERIIGSIRRECLNHVIIFNERHLRKVLKSYARYYHEARTHLSLDKQSPVPRSIETPDQGKVVAIPHVGGLHHEYRRAA